MAKEFVNGIVAKDVPKLDWIVAKLNFNVAQFQEFLDSKKESTKANNGWLIVNVLRSKDGQKIYCQYDDWKPSEEVSASQHSPDRDTAPKEKVDDLPF
tara:strand:- start:1048 stop:1341 length:294 start_codon:yes stop_codon:yes gene_type:complete